nr:immunoglobulin heavy chain junction region [Macaca mulatta]MOW48984.1 immunoglobulin heavy chain junction region [Macaca mulatta]
CASGYSGSWNLWYFAVW